MDNIVFGYARVSTREQNLDRQVIRLREYGIAERNIIVDKESGKNLERAGYQALTTTMLRRGDTLVITSLDRLSRNKADIQREMQRLKQDGIHLRVLDLPTTMMEFPAGQEWVFEMVNNVLIEVIGTIAQQERLTIRERQREGIAAARARGANLGRPRVSLPDNWEDTIHRWQNGEISAVKAMEMTGVRRSTFYRLVKDTSNCGS